MSTRYQFFQKAFLAIPEDFSLPVTIAALDEPLELLVFSAENLGEGVLPGVPFHTSYEGDLVIDTRQRAHVVFELVTRHRLPGGVVFDTSRPFGGRLAANEILDVPMSRFSSVSPISIGATVSDTTSGVDVALTAEQLATPVGIDILLRVSGYEATDPDTRDEIRVDVLRFEDAAVSWWQLYATLDRPPVTPPVPAIDVSGSDPGVGASQALLRVQRALVARFAAFVGGPDGVQDAFEAAGISLPASDMPPAMLFDEPRSGRPASYWRLGDASITIETRAGGVLWEITQDIEAHVDPVRGRAAALVMGDLMERAFAAEQTIGVGPPHGDLGLDRDAWMRPEALALRDVLIEGQPAVSPTPVRVVDIRQTDSRIGFSEAAYGPTYQVIGTWAIVAEPI